MQTLGAIGVALLLGLITLLAGSRPAQVSFSGQFETTHVSMLLAENALIEGIAAYELSVTFSGALFVDGKTSETAYGGVSASSDMIAEDTGGNAIASIEGISVEKGTRLSLTTDPLSNLTTIRFSGPPIEFPIYPGDVQRLDIDSAFCGTDNCARLMVEGEPLYVQTDGKAETILTFPTPEAPVILTSILNVKTLDFWRLVAAPTSQAKESGLLGGAYYFLETADISENIWPRSILSVSGEDVRVRSLELNDSRFDVSASGRIRRFDTEIGNRARSLKPNLFETWSRNPSIQVIAGLLSIVLGSGIVVIEVMRRLNIRNDAREDSGD